MRMAAAFKNHSINAGSRWLPLTIIIAGLNKRPSARIGLLFGARVVGDNSADSGRRQKNHFGLMGGEITR